MLLLEVLRRAAHDWVLYRSSTRLLQRQIAEEAYHWLFKEEPGTKGWIERSLSKKELTSFVSICDVLSLDPEIVRTYIRGLTIKEILSTGRPPTYRRQKERRRKVVLLPPARAAVEPLVAQPVVVAVVHHLPAPVIALRPVVIRPISHGLSELFELASRTLSTTILQMQG